MRLVLLSALFVTATAATVSAQSIPSMRSLDFPESGTFCAPLTLCDGTEQTSRNDN